MRHFLWSVGALEPRTNQPDRLQNPLEMYRTVQLIKWMLCIFVSPTLTWIMMPLHSTERKEKWVLERDQETVNCVYQRQTKHKRWKFLGLFLARVYSRLTELCFLICLSIVVNCMISFWRRVKYLLGLFWAKDSTQNCKRSYSFSRTWVLYYKNNTNNNKNNNNNHPRIILMFG